MDVSVRTNMKGAAKRDYHTELQNSANQQTVERVLLFRAIPASMFASLLFVLFGGGVTSVSCFCAFLLHSGIGCIDTCVLVVLDMRSVEHLLRE